MIDERVFDYLALKAIISENENTISSLIREYLKRDYVEQVKKGLYVAVSMETGAPLASRFEIGSYVLKSGYISHHSAFEYFGYTNQMMHTVQVSGSGRFRPFTFDGYQYQCFQERIKPGVLQKENGIKVTDTERTVLDCINDLEKTGGISELYHCLQMVPFLEEDRLLYYLELYDKQFLYQKAGFILEALKEDLKLTDAFFDRCRERIGRSKRYFTNTMERRMMEYASAWQLYVPKNYKRVMELEE